MGWQIGCAVNALQLIIPVPTVFRHLIFTLGPNDTFPDMRILKLGGEPVYRHDIDNFKRYFPRGAVLRSDSVPRKRTWQLIRSSATTVVDTPLVSLGIITPDIHIDLVDADGNPVPEGTSGEIAVRSRYLSPGYWRDPEATAASYRIVPGSDEAHLSDRRPRLVAALTGS